MIPCNCTWESYDIYLLSVTVSLSLGRVRLSEELPLPCVFLVMLSGLHVHSYPRLRTGPFFKWSLSESREALLALHRTPVGKAG